jgi:hypothetical protein
MSKVSLQAILEQIKQLTPEERKRLRAMLDVLHIRPNDQLNDVLVDALLIEAGLMSQVPAMLLDPADYRAYQSVPVSGQSVSQTLIEERR